MSWFVIYFVLLQKPANVRLDVASAPCCTTQRRDFSALDDDAASRLSDEGTDADVRKVNAGIAAYSTRERFYLLASLWPYMIPLFTVYFAEYAMQV